VSEQATLDPAEYGTAISHPRFVLKCVFEMPGAQLRLFQEAFWWQHQDLYVIRIN